MASFRLLNGEDCLKIVEDHYLTNRFNCHIYNNVIMSVSYPCVSYMLTCHPNLKEVDFGLLIVAFRCMKNRQD